MYQTNWHWTECGSMYLRKNWKEETKMKNEDIHLFLKKGIWKNYRRFAPYDRQ